MNKRLTYTDEASDKFWEIRVDGPQYTVSYGRSGSAGTTQTKAFASDAECLKAAEKVIADKIRKGYSEDGQPSTVIPRPKKDGADLAERFDALIRNRDQDALLPFFRENKKGNAEILRKAIRKSRRYWTEFVELKNELIDGKRTGETWGTRGDGLQRAMIRLSAVVVFSKSDILSWDEVFSFLEKCDEEPNFAALRFAEPDWIAEYLIEQRRRSDWRVLPYPKLRFLEREGLMDFTPELAAASLAQTHWQEASAQERIRMVLADENAWKRDVPLLFRYETNLHNCQYTVTENGKNVDYHTWEILFNKLIDDGKLAPADLLENAILIQTKEWSNNLRSFFRKLLLARKPHGSALLGFQEKIFTCLHASVPAVTTFGMDLVKLLADEPGFDVSAFLEWVEPMLMRADCKTAVKSALQVFEKLLKAQPERSTQILPLLSDVFLIPDLALQERASRMILKWADGSDPQLREKLTSYIDLMHGSVRTELQGFLSETPPTDDLPSENLIGPIPSEPEKVLTEPVRLPENWNDVLFQFGDSIGSVAVASTELLLHTYIAYRHLFPHSYQEQLETYLKQLQGTYFEGYHRGYSTIFFQQKIHDWKFVFRIQQDKYDRINTMLLIVPMLHAVQKRINQKSDIPLLSLPTHLPHWVEPKALIGRIIRCQQENVEMDPVDLAIAIARMPREQVSEAAGLLEDVQGELKPLLAYCLGLSTTVGPIPKQSTLGRVFSRITGTAGQLLPQLWAVAVRTHDPQGHFPEFEDSALAGFPMVIDPFRPAFAFEEKWNEYRHWKTNKLVRSESWYQFGFPVPERPDPPKTLLYSLDLAKSGHDHFGISANEANVLYWNSLTPQNPDAMALQLLRFTCHMTSGSNPDLKAFLTIMIQPGFRVTPNALAVLGCCFFMDAKELRMTASEIFSQLVEKRKMDTAYLGKHCALLASNKYGPFQRMVDSVSGIKDLSGVHNAMLLDFFDSLLAHVRFEGKLPVNFRRLVEHYLDLTYKTGRKPSVGARDFFLEHQEVTTLKTMIRQITEA